MTQLAKVKESSVVLTEEERDLLNYHSEEIKLGIKKGVEAKNIVISHVLEVIGSEPPLWRENYKSEEDYIKTELNIEVSSFWRNVKDNRNYLSLLASTEDINEQITLSRMKGAAYRELRRLVTDNKPVLKKGGESDEDYKQRLEEKEATDSEMIQELWHEVYPRIAKFKEESQTGLYPTGGYSITAKDITETCNVLNQILEVPRLLNEGVSPSEISVSSLEGRDISLQDVLDTSGDNTLEVIDAVRELGVSEALTEKLQRQKGHIQDSLEQRYEYAKFVGTLNIKYGRLIIENQYGEFDLLNELSDLIGKETVISARRTINESTVLDD